MRKCRWVVIAPFLVVSLSGGAQTAMPAGQFSGWQRVQGLAPHSNIRIRGDNKSAICFLQSVEEQRLTCSHSQAGGSSLLVFPRSEIKSIKISRRGHSTVTAWLIGLGTGATLGAVAGIAVNAGDSGFIHQNSPAKPAAAGAVLGAVALGLTGAAVGYADDLFAGPLIYRR